MSLDRAKISECLALLSQIRVILGEVKAHLTEHELNNILLKLKRIQNGIKSNPLNIQNYMQELKKILSEINELKQIGLPSLRGLATDELLKTSQSITEILNEMESHLKGLIMESEEE